MTAFLVVVGWIAIGSFVAGFVMAIEPPPDPFCLLLVVALWPIAVMAFVGALGYAAGMRWLNREEPKR